MDTQGFDQMPGLMKIPLYKRFTGFVVIYDITSKASFNNAKDTLD